MRDEMERVPKTLHRGRLLAPVLGVTESGIETCSGESSHATPFSPKIGDWWEKDGQTADRFLATIVQ